MDFFYTASLDGCATWQSEERYTTETSTNISNGQEWGDYNGLSVVLDKIAMTFTDNRPSIGQTAMVASGENINGSPSFSISADNTDFSVCSNDSGINNTISVGVNQGYNNPVTLSLDSAPGFVTNESFGTNPINPTPGSSTFSFDVDGSGVTGSHTVTIGAVGDEEAMPVVNQITRTLDLNILYSAGITTATTLTSPVDSATNVSLSTTFTWAADANATSYRLMVSTVSNFGSLIVDEVVSGTSFSTVGLPSSTELFWKVATQSACNGSDIDSATFSFTTTALPGDCAIGLVPKTFNTYNFESGAQGWTHSALTGQDGWSLSGVNPHSGVQAMHGAPFEANNDTVLVSPEITLPTGVSPLTLQFWNRQEMEDRAGGCWDGGILEISTDGGTSFNQVANSALFSDPYDGPINGGPLTGSDGWCGDPQEYLNSIVDIDNLSGQTVQFRFRKSNDSSVAHQGWDIDDVKVIGCEVFVDPIYANGFEAPTP